MPDFLDYEGLQEYDEQIKAYIQNATGEQYDAKTVTRINRTTPLTSKTTVVDVTGAGKLYCACTRDGQNKGDIVEIIIDGETFFNQTSVIQSTGSLGYVALEGGSFVMGENVNLAVAGIGQIGYAKNVGTPNNIYYGSDGAILTVMTPMAVEFKNSLKINAKTASKDFVALYALKS